MTLATTVDVDGNYRTGHWCKPCARTVPGDHSHTVGGNPIPDGRCVARTRKGRPCRSNAKAGYVLCGPHLDMRAKATR